MKNEIGEIVWVPNMPIPLTKRELFAALAMQGDLANPLGSKYTEEEMPLAAQSWTACADALIAELEKGKE